MTGFLRAADSALAVSDRMFSILDNLNYILKSTNQNLKNFLFIRARTASAHQKHTYTYKKRGYKYVALAVTATGWRGHNGFSIKGRNLMLKHINAPGTKWPGLSQGMVLTGSGIFVSGGHCGLDASGEPITTSVEDQIVAMFENLKKTLAEAGLGFEHVARATYYVSKFDPDLLATIKAVRARYYNQDCPPASVMVQAGLYDDRLYAETEVFAAVR